MKVNLGGEEIEIPVKKLSLLGQLRGLMFSRREKAKALLFNYKGAIHSFFVFYKFIILWLDEKNNVLEYQIIRPFKFHINSKEKYSKFIEIPINRRYNPINRLLVGIDGERFKKKR